MSEESEAVASAYGLRDRTSTFDQLRAEVERLKVCASNEAAAAESLRRERDHLRKDLQEIAAGCGVGCPDEAEAKRRIIAIRTERDQLQAELVRLRANEGQQPHDKRFSGLSPAEARVVAEAHARSLIDFGKLVRAAYAQEFEDDSGSPLEDLIRHAFTTLAERSIEIRKLQAQLKEAKANEAVCHCGALLSEHTQNDNHGAVGQAHPCPHQPPAKPTPKWFATVADTIDRYGHEGYFGRHIEDGPCLSCAAARVAADLHHLAERLKRQ